MYTETGHAVMLFTPSQDAALVSSPHSLVKLPTEGCSLYPTCEVCARARPLGCVWRQKEAACSLAVTE